MGQNELQCVFVVEWKDNQLWLSMHRCGKIWKSHTAVKGMVARLRRHAGLASVDKDCNVRLASVPSMVGFYEIKELNKIGLITVNLYVVMQIRIATDTKMTLLSAQWQQTWLKASSCNYSQQA